VDESRIAARPDRSTQLGGESMSAVQHEENAHATSRPSEACAPVLGVTLYDRVTALLLSLIVTLGGATLVFGGLWAANQDWNRGEKLVKIREQPILFDDSDNGGDPWGAPGDTDPSSPGEPGSEPVSAQDFDWPTTDAPDLNQAITTLVSQFTDDSIDAEQLIIQPDFPRSYIQSGSDKKGIRGPLGEDPSKRGGGVPRAKRWQITYERGLTEAEYAKQLDFFRVELATVSGGKLYRVSNLALPHPTAVLGQAGTKELYFQWRDAARREVDLGLLRKATEVPLAESAIVLHFYPPALESKLLRMEIEHASQHGRPDLRQVAKTIFVVKKTETGYDFEVAKQTYLVQQM
jgi:hypothetical protein